MNGVKCLWVMREGPEMIEMGRHPGNWAGLLDSGGVQDGAMGAEWVWLRGFLVFDRSGVTWHGCRNGTCYVSLDVARNEVLRGEVWESRARQSVQVNSGNPFDSIIECDRRRRNEPRHSPGLYCLRN